ncbi:ParB N-terminal domain-containing protein, partial [Salmonella enterica subsp. enterica serovar Paratyphi A]
MIRTKSPEEAGLALALIQIDGGTQSRANVNDQVVNEYAEAIQAGATFPPIVVFYDGKKHWLADGFHRFHAYRKLGREKVAADIRQGTRRDAILHSVGANETHGLRRTRDDKRRAVETLLNDAEWWNWSDGEIAKRCAVSREYVNRIRPKDTCDQVTGMERTFVHPKTGKPTTMKTAGINASRATQTVAREFRAPEGTTPEPSVSKASSAKTVDLGTTSPSVPSVVLQMAWDRATHQERAVFLARNNL